MKNVWHAVRQGGPVGFAIIVTAVLLFALFSIRDPAAATAMLSTVVLVGGGVLLGRRLLVSARWHRPIRLLRAPVPESWADIARENVPITRRLDDEDFGRLLKLMQVFLEQKRIEGAGGFEVTEEAEVTIAAQACLLLLWRNTGMYPGLRTVIVYPDAVVPRYARQHAYGGVETEEPPSPVLGQSWGMGVVILSWDSALHGAFDPRDGHNVVMHEFAHQLDQETGDADGRPVGLALSALKPWAEVMERRFRQPDLYALLSDFYGVDPAEGMRPRAL